MSVPEYDSHVSQRIIRPLWRRRSCDEFAADPVNSGNEVVTSRPETAEYESSFCVCCLLDISFDRLIVPISLPSFLFRQ